LGLAREFVANASIEDTSDLKTNLGEIRSRGAFENKMMKKYSDLKDSEDQVCPTCSQQIDINFIEKQYEEHELAKQELVERLDYIQSEIDKIERNNEVYSRMKQKIDEWESLFRSIDQKLPTEVPNSNDLQEQIEKIRGRIRDRKSRVEEIIAENEKRERHNTRLSIIQEQQTDFETQLDELSAGIGELEDKLSHVEILKKAFSTNGLLAYKIENLVKDLEELTNEYLAELSDGRFSLEFVVLNDKLNVEIDDNGKTVDILALSAGELARVNTSTLLAIRKLMSSISKSRINVLFLDEVTNVLDELGKERLVELLLREENLNTYIVSHGWTHPLLSKIEVIKEDKISRLDGQS